jgi:uncharacterized protein YbbK (DUF523 family)
MGRSVRYDGGHSAASCEELERWRREERLVVFCPEVAGGLSTPRAPAEIVGGDGEDVLDGHARVVTESDVDVTEAFLCGARGALRAALGAGVKLAVLKSKSPSCGSKAIYDGSFSSARISGQGVTSALLSRHGVRVFTEHQWADADAYVRQLESQHA